MMYTNFKAVFQIFIFTCIRAIEHNIQYLLFYSIILFYYSFTVSSTEGLEFKMSISKLWLCVHNWDFSQVIILFSVIKQQIINGVQKFSSSFLNFDFYML